MRGNTTSLAYDSNLPFAAHEWTPSLLVDYSTVRMNSGDVLIATVSNDPALVTCTANCSQGNGHRCYLTIYDNYVGASSTNCQGGSSPTKKAAVLTCLVAPPPETATGQAKSFRPPYAGNPASRLFTNRFGTGSQVIENHLTLDTLQPQRPLLPGLTPTGFPTPAAFGLIQFFDKVWLDHTNEWAENILNPTDHMPGYGAHLAEIVSQAALVLMESRPNEAADVEALLRGVLQVGIDTFGLYNDSRDFIGGGGKRAARKWPMFFAGIMLQRPEMSVQGSFPGYPVSPSQFLFRFKEDDQVYIDGNPPAPATPGFPFRPDWQGSKWKWCSTHSYGGVNLNFTDSAPDTTTPRYGTWGGATYASWQYAHWNNESYRFCCTSAEAVGFNLAARMIPGGITAWQNEAFFGYFDRYMLPLSDLACAKYDTNPNLDPLTPHLAFHRARSHVLSTVAPSASSPSAAELYSLNMWRSYRWRYNQEGVVGVYPFGFAGTEFDCNDVNGLPNVACQVPQQPMGPPPLVRRTRYPVLVCHDRPVVGGGVYAEVFDMPPNGILGYLVTLAGNVSGVPGTRLSPNDCLCVPAAAQPSSLCGAPVFGNLASLGTAQVGNLTLGPYGFDKFHMPIPLDAATVNLEWVLQGIVFQGTTVSTTNAYHFRNLAQ